MPLIALEPSCNPCKSATDGMSGGGRGKEGQKTEKRREGPTDDQVRPMPSLSFPVSARTT